MARPQLYKATGTVEEAVLDVDKSQGIVDVLWSRFDNMDSDKDIIDLGAYKKTIEEMGPGGANRIKVLWNHMHLIGKPISLEESTAHNGLVVRQKITPTAGTYGGRNALLLYFDGVFTEHSVRISSIRRKGEDPPESAHIIEAKLWEGGPQIWGANQLTPTLSAKSEVSVLQLGYLSTQIEKCQAALKTGITDELAEELELWLDNVKASFSELTEILKKDAPISLEPDPLVSAPAMSHPEDAPRLKDDNSLLLQLAKRLNR